jgi:hypothetical protein
MGCRAAGQVSIKALVGVSYLHGCQLVYFHGVGNRFPTRVSGGARALGSRRVSWPTHQSGWRLCEAETSRARRRLLVRGRDLSSEEETSRARRRLVVEDHVWFEDRWMVASLCNE